MCTSNTLSPQVQPMEVCVCAHSGSALFSYAWLWILSYIRTYFHRVYVDSIYPLSKESSVCVCVCVCVCGSMSLSLSLSPSNGGVCAPSPSPSLIPSFPIPFSLFFPYTPLSLSLSLYVVLPHVSYPTFTCFSHPISICGHRTVKAPYPVRSAKLSTVSTS